MNIWHDIDHNKITPDAFAAVIEISKGSSVKYEMDKETGMLRMDRVLYTATHYPGNYGFIPRTYAEDDDPLDVLVLCSEPILPLTLVRCYPIGVMGMEDEHGRDEKIIAIPFEDPAYSCFTDIDQLARHTFAEIEHFFSVYKELENKVSVTEHVRSAREAKQVIKESMERYVQAVLRGELNTKASGKGTKAI